MPIEVKAITDGDVRRIGGFFHTHLNAAIAPDLWARSLDVPWEVRSPNRGFMLLDRGAIVGAHVAFYSERTIDGRREKFCNLGPWCVLAEYRLQGLRLLMALLAQDGYHFTDFTPSEAVVSLNAKLGFRFLDTAAVLMLNLPWRSWRGRSVASSDPAMLARILRGPALEIYRDHATAPAVRHLVILGRETWCYVMFQIRRWRRLPIASLLHVSEPELLPQIAPPLARYLLTHYGAVATRAEIRVVKRPPARWLALRDRPSKMFRSAGVRPEQIDDLYSELVCLPW